MYSGRVAVSASKHWAFSSAPRCCNSNGTLLLCFSLFMGSHHYDAKKSLGKNSLSYLLVLKQVALVGLLHVLGCSET